MQITDKIADMLTRIRNANAAKHDTVDVPSSNMKKAIAQILLDEGYIKGFQIVDDGKQGVIRITLKYGLGKEPVITGLRRVSKPGTAHLHQLQGNAESYERHGYRNHVHSKGHHDRQTGSRRECRRRSPCICLVRRCKINVSNW